MAQDVTEPPPVGDNDLARVLNIGAAHFRAGRLEEAKAVYNEILRQHPGSGGARHFLGLIAHAEGDHGRAVELLEEAIAKTGTIAFFHGNLGEIYRSLGRNSEAAARCRRALELTPVYPEALNTLGAVLYEEGDLDEAEEHLRRTIEFKPDFAEAHANLGNVHRAKGRFEKAVKAYERALRHDSQLVGVRMVLGNALRSQDRLADAVACYREALDTAPDDAKIWSNLGATLHGMERNDEALECCRQAVRLQPRLAEAHVNLGTCFLVLENLHGALESYRTAFALKRTPTWDKPEEDRRRQRLAEAMDPRFHATTPGKLRHDIAQFRYLLDKGQLPPAVEAEIAHYETVLQELEAAPSDKPTFILSSAQRESIADTYNKAVHVAPAPALAGDPLDPDLDTDAIQQDYLSHPPGITHFDGLLRPEALEALRRYCLESALWFDFTGRPGCLGASLSEGFDCALLLQIAESLRQSFPQVIGERALRHIVAYDYGNRMDDDDPHVEFAAVGATFWITPDAANLDPGTGGLQVFTRETSAEANLGQLAGDPEAVRTFLKDSDSTTIAYRQNRAVLFDAALFHRSGAIRFDEGYENRRIAITMLFGRRGDAPKAS